MKYSNACLRLFVVILQNLRCLHGKVQYTNDQCCDKISVNNVNLVIQPEIASGKHFCISLTRAPLNVKKAPLNVKIGITIKCNTPMINIVIRSL